MKVFIPFLLSFLLTSKAVAQNQCFENETNAASKKIFTEADWKASIADWDALEPQDPGLIKLFAAWSVYKKEAPAVKKIKGDKRKHCYMGCRIAQEVSLDTAIYVAWLKEKEDLTDCNKKTLFESRDFEVTVDGAELAGESSDKSFCLEECSQIQRYR